MNSESSFSKLLPWILALLIPVAGVFGYFVGKQTRQSSTTVPIVTPRATTPPGAQVLPTPITSTEPLPVEPVPGETDPGNMVACTMDAKMCPDGSYVGRTGPNCEFAPCPGE